MTNFLFWNTKNNQNIDDILIDTIIENDCNIVVLAEYTNDINNLCNQLSYYRKDFKPLSFDCNRLKIITTSEYKSETVQDGEEYFIIQNISIINKHLLLVGVHLPSKMHCNEYKLSILTAQIIRDIHDSEIRANNSNTIILGDFNANPFETTCIGANCFHGLPSRKLVAKENRIIYGNTYNMYYNPMWNLFGDFNGIGGTFYSSRGDEPQFFWNIFDQVIMSPTIINSFITESLRIVTSVNGQSLLNKNGVINSNIASDHLPIFFQIKEEKLND